MGKIRNISQSVQERELIKTCPDLVVYLEGLPYLQNPFLTTNPKKPVLVNFNDFVTSFNANYDIDQAVPTCAITLVVPAHLRYLFQAPGGTNLIKSMMQVQVFAKGYYFANDGNTIFHRVFKGFTSHITHTDDGKALDISIQCSGILGFFDMMQIDLSPAVQSSSPTSMTPLKSILASMSPYAQLAFTFLYPSFTDGFYVNSLLQPTIEQTDYFAAIQDSFIAKWQTILADISREAHIYGLQVKDIKDTFTFLQTIAKAAEQKGSKGWSFLAAQEAFLSNIKESNSATDIQNTAKIRRFLPDLGLGTLQLLNGRVTSRLEFLRSLTRLINYECYQDIDGQIILKPPLYNLDVTNLGSDTESDANNLFQDSHKNTNFTNATNPFIANLAEILNESETEDQGAVRATRMVIQGNTTSDSQFVQINAIMRATGEFIDLPKLAQFGLREEPARTIAWLQDNEPFAVFAQCAAEMALANRAFRTYSFSIPMRPELHLGFPMYIPHRDMYGYIKSVNISYQIGGGATMGITLDAIRKRPMFPQEQVVNNVPTTIFVAQPNLVLKWTQGGDTQQVSQGGIQDPSLPPSNLVGNQISLRKPPDSLPVTADQKALLAFQQQQMGSYFALSSDTTDASWRVQFDTEHVWSADTPAQVPGFFREVDASFYADVRNTIPFTDEKGYEVLIPFPWGRWLDIKSALQEFTRDGYVFQPQQQASGSDFRLVQGVNTFLYAGMGTPSSTGDASSSLQQALSTLQTSVGVNPNTGNTAPGAVKTSPSASFVQSQGELSDITIFELDYSNFNSLYSPGGAASIIQVAQPDSRVDSALIRATDAAEQQKVNMFLTGASPQPDLTLASQVKAVGNTTEAAGQIPLQPGQFATQP